MVTCYDASFARICADLGELDYVLVGDTLGMVIYGDKNTWSVSLEKMLAHVKAVRNGFEQSSKENKPVLIADMPIHTYDTADEALVSAEKLGEAGADMFKVEGAVYEVVNALVASGYRVCGHIGLTPQSIEKNKVQGREESEARRLEQEALELEKAGCEILVLELMPKTLSGRITQALRIPTVGIGAGPETDGQVLVLYDLLGLNPDFNPRFLKKYAAGYEWVTEALGRYVDEVRQKKFPTDKHSFS